MVNSIQQLYREIVRKLKLAQFEDSDVIALFIIEFIYSKKYLILVSESIQVTQDKKDQIMNALDQYMSGIPLVYIFNEASFRNNQYFVSEGVLIPRPETEEMVDYLIDIIHKLMTYDSSMSVFELGLGSGVISLELAQEFPEISFIGSDISKVAINVATHNKRQLNVNNLDIVYGDFFEVIGPYVSDNLCLMVSNPPYVSYDEYQLLSSYVLKEPKEALVAAADGLAIILDSINFCINHSFIYVAEIGFNQHEKITKIFPNEMIYFLKDYSGHNRFIVYIPKLFKWGDDFGEFLIHLNK